MLLRPLRVASLLPTPRSMSPSSSTSPTATPLMMRLPALPQSSGAQISSG